MAAPAPSKSLDLRAVPPVRRQPAVGRADCNRGARAADDAYLDVLAEQHGRRYVPVGLVAGYGLGISGTSTRLYLRCTNCGVIFPSDLDMASAELDRAEVADRTYKCPVCANFDTYGKEDLFYDRDH